MKFSSFNRHNVYNNSLKFTRLRIHAITLTRLKSYIVYTIQIFFLIYPVPVLVSTTTSSLFLTVDKACKLRWKLSQQPPQNIVALASKLCTRVDACTSFTMINERRKKKKLQEIKIVVEDAKAQRLKPKRPPLPEASNE